MVEIDNDVDGTFDEAAYYHTDGLGSVTVLTDGAGTPVKTYRYDTFGNVLEETGSLTQPYSYTGREWDSETGLYFYRARYYDPVAGRFIAEDPVGLIAGINLYEYVTNNPIRWTDPFGLAKCDEECEEEYFDWKEFAICMGEELTGLGDLNWQGILSSAVIIKVGYTKWGIKVGKAMVRAVAPALAKRWGPRLVPGIGWGLLSIQVGNAIFKCMERAKKCRPKQENSEGTEK